MADASMQEVSPETLGQTTAKTVFTDTIGRAQLILEPRNWTKVKLRLETAGPVAIGLNNSNIIPVLNGIGALLGANELELTMKKGDRLFYGVNAMNRVRMVTEPFPWWQQITMTLWDIYKALTATASAPPPPPAPKNLPVTGSVRGRRW